MKVLGLALICAVAAMLLAGNPARASAKVDWDQVANIKEAAVRLGNIQRRQGATKAFEFIVACYKTHGMATKFTRYFEGCIAQDLIHTQTLATIYSRMPPATLKKMGAPSPKFLAQAMAQRVGGAFGKYSIAPEDATAFRKLVEKHGFQPFAEIVFPKPAKGAKDTNSGQEQKQDKP